MRQRSRIGIHPIKKAHLLRLLSSNSNFFTMQFTHENTGTAIDMNYVQTVERDHRNLFFLFKDGEKAILKCQTDYIAEELICLLTEFTVKNSSSLWVHEYHHPHIGYSLEHLMET